MHDLFDQVRQSPDSSSTAFLWLRSLFRYELLKCRIVTYHYEAQKLLAPGSGSQLALLSQATVLVNSVVAEREAIGASQRPVIFICHGFGGLLVQQGLALTRESNDAPERFQDLSAATYAIILAGTPHSGIASAALSVLYTDPSDPPNQLVLDLLNGSELLEEVRSSFRPLLKSFRLVTFWEQVQTKTNNASSLIVDEESAAPLDYTHERNGLMSDHSNLLTFSSANDPSFRMVNTAVESCVRDSVRGSQHKVAKRFREIMKSRQGTQSQTQGHNIWQNQITGRAVHLGDVYVYNTIESSKFAHSTQGTSEPFNLNTFMPISKGDCQMYRVGRSSSPQFTGRQLQAEMLNNGFVSPQKPEYSDKHKIAVVYGLGGSGKTQFCPRFAEQHRSQ